MCCPRYVVTLKSEAAQWYFFYEQMRGQRGLIKTSQKPSFPCACDRITAVRTLNCPERKLKMAISTPLPFVYDWMKQCWRPWYHGERRFQWGVRRIGFHTGRKRKMFHVKFMCWIRARMGVYKSRRRGCRVQTVTGTASACCRFWHSSSQVGREFTAVSFFLPSPVHFSKTAFWRSCLGQHRLTSISQLSYEKKE